MKSTFSKIIPVIAIVAFLVSASFAHAQPATGSNGNSAGSGAPSTGSNGNSAGSNSGAPSTGSNGNSAGSNSGGSSSGSTGGGSSSGSKSGGSRRDISHLVGSPVKNVSVATANATTLRVSWTTAVASKGQLAYGTKSIATVATSTAFFGYAAATQPETAYTTTHSAEFGIVAGMTYYVRPIAITASGDVIFGSEIAISPRAKAPEGTQPVKQVEIQNDFTAPVEIDLSKTPIKVNENVIVLDSSSTSSVVTATSTASTSNIAAVGESSSRIRGFFAELWARIVSIFK